MKRSIDRIDEILTVITWIGYVLIFVSTFLLSWEMLGAGTLVALIATGLYEVRG